VGPGRREERLVVTRPATVCPRDQAPRHDRKNGPRPERPERTGQRPPCRASSPPAEDHLEDDENEERIGGVSGRSETASGDRGPEARAGRSRGRTRRGTPGATSRGGNSAVSVIFTPARTSLVSRHKTTAKTGRRKNAIVGISETTRPLRRRRRRESAPGRSRSAKKIHATSARSPPRLSNIGHEDISTRSGESRRRTATRMRPAPEVTRPRSPERRRAASHAAAGVRTNAVKLGSEADERFRPKRA